MGQGLLRAGLQPTANTRNPSGQPILPQVSMVYLGATSHSNGKFGCEICRKIGKATATFRSLQTIYKHARMSSRRKLQMFESLVLRQLRYALASAWLLKSDLRRLAGFQTGASGRSLRFLLHIFRESATNESGSRLVCNRFQSL